MIFAEAALQGVYTIDLQPIDDDRGFFARTFCKKEFEAYGLHTDLVQCNLSNNRKSGTVRGMHYQLAPYEEVKLVQCVRGAIYDVVIDLRPSSATYLQWNAFELNEFNRRMLYIPEGFAHGFQTLQDETEVFYQMGNYYYPEASRGIRWNDPQFGIEWPLACEVISDKDQSYPEFNL
ncbi:dTDP-4-dehydrorhamnose 3,5-epimerase [Paenibacillus mendelii]|uniref:dTDP-4-dehydrorhamnose 3,5-epimerase n=1 Tax=Paenibacillus mendelii TaxID=206163 RepID=A0ABV6J3F1_9BACL|nr:dTDP-4-dehydrorhamnose 3,5-epimerase [Paenibacillus mendelii]MCQ6563573.1 dTDP-4-dehydrorhamnose 3,5-epimerase [Paenibacillus mendelii]